MTPAQTSGLSRGREKTLADGDYIKGSALLVVSASSEKKMRSMPLSKLLDTKEQQGGRRAVRAQRDDWSRAGSRGGKTKELTRARHAPTSRESMRGSLIKETESIVRRNVQSEGSHQPHVDTPGLIDLARYTGMPGPAHTKNQPPPFSMLAGMRAPGGGSAQLGGLGLGDVAQL